MSDSGRVFVRKYGQIARNIERLNCMAKLGISVPAIYDVTDDYYDMEYVNHIDIKTWLTNNSANGLIDWLLHVIDILAQDSTSLDFTDIFINKLSSYERESWWKSIPFTANDLLKRLPTQLPAGNYHGDFTLDNCLHGTNNRWYTIDPLTSEFNSYIFDCAKLMQDIESKWFIRNAKIKIDSKLLAIKSKLVTVDQTVGDPHLIILMLLRILPYARQQADQTFLIEEIKRLWIS